MEDDGACEHVDFVANVVVSKVVSGEAEDGPSGHLAEVQVNCAWCEEPFVFHGNGLPVGVLTDRPAIAPDGTRLYAPIRPESSDPMSGLDLIGFRMRALLGDDISPN